MEYHSNYFEMVSPRRGGKSHRVDLDKRLALLVKYVKHPLILDIGCSGGYFDFGLLDRREDIKFILAIDKEEDLIGECMDIQAENNIPTDNLFFQCMDIEDYIGHPSELLDSDIEQSTCIYMSTHHHVIQQFGLKIATFILRILSFRFDQMIFDMGQKDENCNGYEWWELLPDTNDPQQWLEEYILENTVFETAEVIGTSKVHGIERFLFNLE